MGTDPVGMVGRPPGSVGCAARSRITEEPRTVEPTLRGCAAPVGIVLSGVPWKGRGHRPQTNVSTAAGSRTATGHLMAERTRVQS